MNIQLYYAPITCALAPYITLTEAGAEFEAIPLNFRQQQHMSPEYLAINPKHKVPMLVVDGKKMTENVAIQQWIARTFPAAKLLPEDGWDELQAVSLVSWCSSGIHPFLRVINGPPKVCDISGTEENIRDHAAEHVYECFQIAENLLDGKEYFFKRTNTHKYVTKIFSYEKQCKNGGKSGNTSRHCCATNKVTRYFPIASL